MTKIGLIEGHNSLKLKNPTEFCNHRNFVLFRVENHTSLPYTVYMLFIEAPIFTKHIYDYLDDEEYSALQQTIALRPDVGKIIPGSGGLRKLRWAGSGRGKRGGLRIIYYWLREDGHVWLLTIYAKNEAKDIPHAVLKMLRKEIEK